MTKTAENKADSRLEAVKRELAAIREALANGQLRVALWGVERLRIGHGWRYAKFAAEFGLQEWEAIAQQLDALDDSEAESGWDCKACGGDMMLLGKMGKTEHGRCRACGIMAVK